MEESQTGLEQPEGECMMSEEFRFLGELSL